MQNSTVVFDANNTPKTKLYKITQEIMLENLIQALYNQKLMQKRITITRINYAADKIV